MLFWAAITFLYDPWIKTQYKQLQTSDSLLSSGWGVVRQIILNGLQYLHAVVENYSVIKDQSNEKSQKREKVITQNWTDSCLAVNVDDSATAGLLNLKSTNDWNVSHSKGTEIWESKWGEVAWNVASLQEDNIITVWNNGDGVPVEIHKDEKVYVPELIFGHLLTSSNYNDSEKKVSNLQWSYQYLTSAI